MNDPTICCSVVVRNHGMGTGDAPGIVTRSWGPNCINVHVMYEGQTAGKSSVKFFQTEAEAAKWLHEMPGHTPTVAFWPNRV